MITIGIDPSINSTGVCVNNNNKCTYFIISSKKTKKMQEFSNMYIQYKFYDKLDGNTKDLKYDIKEYNKSINTKLICDAIFSIIKKYRNKDVTVYMEGVSYGSSNSAALVDLSGLNFAIRYMLLNNGIPFIIVSPSQNKKFATGNGSADKNLMVYSWLILEKHLKDITSIKIDDLADAYFLSNYYKNSD